VSTYSRYVQNTTTVDAFSRDVFGDDDRFPRLLQRLDSALSDDISMYPGKVALGAAADVDVSFPTPESSHDLPDLMIEESVRDLEEKVDARATWILNGRNRVVDVVRIFEGYPIESSLELRVYLEVPPRAGSELQVEYLSNISLKLPAEFPSDDIYRSASEEYRLPPSEDIDSLDHLF